MSFNRQSKGPFNLKNTKTQMHPKDTGKRKKIKKTKGELLEELKNKKGFEVHHFMSVSEVHIHVISKGLTLENDNKHHTWLAQCTEGTPPSSP